MYDEMKDMGALQEYLTYVDLASDYRKMAEEVKGRVIDAMKGHGANTCSQGNYRATLYTVTNSRFDREAFDRDNPGLYDKYCRAKSYDRFDVKEIDAEVQVKVSGDISGLTFD